MTASERLKALVEGFFEDTAPSGWEAPEEVIRALPELIAVVEAAERVKSIALDGDHALKDERIFDNLYEALAALDAKLSVT